MPSRQPLNLCKFRKRPTDDKFRAVEDAGLAALSRARPVVLTEGVFGLTARKCYLFFLLSGLMVEPKPNFPTRTATRFCAPLHLGRSSGSHVSSPIGAGAAHSFFLWNSSVLPECVHIFLPAEFSDPSTTWPPPSQTAQFQRRRPLLSASRHLRYQPTWSEFPPYQTPFCLCSYTSREQQLLGQSLLKRSLAFPTLGRRCD